MHVQQIADERGSVLGVQDAGGSVNLNRYDEYGVASAANRFQYTGQAWMAPGLYNYRARVYAPELGRFLQTDPIGYAAGPNLSAYVGNDPVNRIDPLGLQEVPNPGDVNRWFPRPGSGGGVVDPWGGGMGTYQPDDPHNPEPATDVEDVIVTGERRSPRSQSIDRGRLPQCMADFVRRHSRIPIDNVRFNTGNPSRGSLTLSSTLVWVPSYIYRHPNNYYHHIFHELYHTVQYQVGLINWERALASYLIHGYPSSPYEQSAEIYADNLSLVYETEEPCGPLPR